MKEKTSQEIKKLHEELDLVKELVQHVIGQMQIMQQRIDQLQQDSVLWVPQHDDGIVDDKVTAVDLSKVVLIDSENNIKNTSVLSKGDLEYQENRRKRKVRKLNFETR